MIMMNHAAWVNGKRHDVQSKSERRVDESAVFNGKKLEDLNSDEMAGYYGSW
jgi:hypothetical protein